MLPDARHGQSRSTGNRCPRSPGSSWLGPLPHPGRSRTGRHMDPGRAGGHASRRSMHSAQGEPGSPAHRRPGRRLSQRVSGGRGAGRAVLWLADRPARSKKAVLHHAGPLPRSHRPQPRSPRISTYLRVLPVPHRLRNRRRIRRHQLGHPGADPSAIPRAEPISRSTEASG